MATGNVTVHCIVVCPFLTELNYDLDTKTFFCSYHEWAYAIAALLCTIATILPIGFLLSFCAKRKIRQCHERLKNRPSRQPSLTSTDGGSKFYHSHESDFEPHHSLIHNRDRMHDWKGASYGPYGTFSSLPDKLESEIAQGHIYSSSHGQDYFGRARSEADFRPHLEEELEPSLIKFDFSHYENIPGGYVTQEQCQPSANSGAKKRIYPDLEASFHDNNAPILIPNKDKGIYEAARDRKYSAQQLSAPFVSGLNNASVEHVDESEEGIGSVSDRASNSGAYDDDEAHKHLSPYQFSLPTRKDYEDYLIRCVAKKPEDERNGTFMVRDSLSYPNSKVLMLYCKSVDVPRNVYYFKLSLAPNGRLYVEGPTYDTFESLDELVLYHRKYRSFFPCLLGEYIETDILFQASTMSRTEDIG